PRGARDEDGEPLRQSVHQGLVEGGDPRGDDLRHRHASPSTCRVSSLTRFSMFRMSSVSYSSMEKMIVYASFARRLFTRMWRNSLRIFVLLWIARLLMESRITRFFRSAVFRIRYSTLSMRFSSIVGLSTYTAWPCFWPGDIMMWEMQSTN